MQAIVSSSFRLARSAHCKSSRNKTSGCELVANNRQEILERQLEAVLRHRGWQWLSDRLGPYHERKFRHELDYDAKPVAKRLHQALLPRVDASLVLVEDLIHEFANRPANRAVWDIALQLVVFSGYEVAAAFRERSMRPREPVQSCQFPNTQTRVRAAMFHRQPIRTPSEVFGFAARDRKVVQE